MIELAVQIPVILQAQFDTVGETGPLDPLASVVELLLRQGNGRDLMAATCGEFGKAAPAAPDLEDVGPGGGVELIQQALVLALLGTFQCLVAAAEQGRGVAHARIQPHAIEVVA